MKTIPGWWGLRSNEMVRRRQRSQINQTRLCMMNYLFWKFLRKSQAEQAYTNEKDFSWNRIWCVLSLLLPPWHSYFYLLTTCINSFSSLWNRNTRETVTLWFIQLIGRNIFQNIFSLNCSILTNNYYWYWYWLCWLSAFCHVTVTVCLWEDVCKKGQA